MIFLQHRDVYGDGKLESNTIVGEKLRSISAVLSASASGNPDTLRLFLDNPSFDPLVKFEGATALHYAANAMIPCDPLYHNFKINRFLCFPELLSFHLDPHGYEKEQEDVEWTPKSYLGRQACITMLLQAGVDIWEKDDRGRFAEPGEEAPIEVQLWWHGKMAQETSEAKKSLNDAANAIAVVAALVATASFVGPLQPPLGYGGDSMGSGVQDTHLSIRVFMVSNGLSFYLTIASIMFAVVPSLPMPQEGIYAEWQRTRRTVAMAIFFLLMSVLGVLISFGAASNSVVSKDYSWQHNGLSFYPTLVGGFICIVAISLFFLRLLRLVFNKNAKIRYLYKKFVKF